MNRTEAAYAHHLQCQKLAGVILDWKFEPIKLRLADKIYYTPDFFVLERDGTFTVAEVKGYRMDDARAKLKIAADQFPWFRLRTCQLVKKAWQTENIPPYDLPETTT